MSENIITCHNLDEAIEHYKTLGYRLDMIFPADEPREALVSTVGERIRLVTKNHHVPMEQIGTPLLGKEGSWIRGRAGMEYRALSPRFSGHAAEEMPPKGGTPNAVAAHHIRLTKGGEVPDYVHYHKVDFQMIYCVKGRIKVVYEDQGPPFWLRTGDCVLQPPEIRHRVLYADGGAEVIEVSMPASHETWVEHEMTLPTDTVNRKREFNSQRFVHHVPENNADGLRDTGIRHATSGIADVRIARENGVDGTILLTFSGLFAKGHGALPAPISIEIPV